MTRKELLDELKHDYLTAKTTLDDPPIAIAIGNKTYDLQGYDEYTFRYELRAEQRAEHK